MAVVSRHPGAQLLSFPSEHPSGLRGMRMVDKHSPKAPKHRVVAVDCTDQLAIIAGHFNGDAPRGLGTLSGLSEIIRSSTRPRQPINFSLRQAILVPGFPLFRSVSASSRFQDTA